jgi:O-antigen ligase
MFNNKQQYIFVLSIPVINVIADSTQDYFQAGIASPGYIRALIILAFLIIHFKNYYRRNSLNNIILISLIYYFILGFFSSDVLYSQSVFLKYFIASMMFPLGYYYFRTEEQLRSLLNVLMWVLGIYIFFLIISNIFSLGSSDYLEGSIYFGAGRVNMTKSMMILVLMSPLSIRFARKKSIKKIYIIIVVVAIIFILLGVKRSALLGLLIGYFVYYILAPQKTRVAKGLFVIGVILLIASPLYFNTFAKRFAVRQEEGRFDVSQAEEEEGRVVELINTWNSFKSGSIAYKLFGAEFFNSMAYFKTRRMLHTDYATMLSGSGIVGLFLFLLIYYLIFRRSYIVYKSYKANSNVNDIMAVSITLIIAILITGIAGTVTGVGLRSLAFLFWGASFSLLSGSRRVSNGKTDQSY